MSKNTPSRKRNQEGSVLFLALVLVVAISAGASLAWMRMHQEMDRQRELRHGVAAQWIAEGGIQYALHALREDPSFRGVEQQALGDGFFRVSVTPEGEGYEVESSAWLEERGPKPFAVYVMATLVKDASGNWVVVAFDSERKTP